MNIAFIGLETLKALYERGHISAAALTAIAPITWLARNYPELLKDTEQAVEALASTEFTKPLNIKGNSSQATCGSCIHFSSIHKLCKTRIDESNTYLAVEANTLACKDFEGVKLPNFLKSGGEQ